MEFEELKRVRTLYNGIVVAAAKKKNTDCKYEPLKKVFWFLLWVYDLWKQELKIEKNYTNLNAYWD